MKWNASYSIGVEKIDNQHQRLMEMVTRLENTLTSGNASESMGQTLKSLVDYTNYHFKDEQDLMVQINFSEYPEQKELHKAFIDEVRGILLLEEFNSLHTLKEEGLIDKDDEKRIGRELSAKLDLAAILSNDESVEDSLTHLNGFLEKKIISKEAYDTVKKEILKRIA